MSNPIELADDLREIAKGLAADTEQLVAHWSDPEKLRQSAALLEEMAGEVESLRGCLDHHTPQNDLDATAYSTLAVELAAKQAECEELRRQLEGEKMSRDLHIKRNQEVADALGQSRWESWHDLGEKVAALRARVAELESEAEDMEGEIRAMGERDD